VNFSILQVISKPFQLLKAANPLAKDLLKKEKNTITKIKTSSYPKPTQS
jgi:hypothetical protein